jgi:hypothetical protein
VAREERRSKSWMSWSEGSRKARGMKWWKGGMNLKIRREG